MTSALFDANADMKLCEPAEVAALAGDPGWNPRWPSQVGADRDAFSALGSEVEPSDPRRDRGRPTGSRRRREDPATADRGTAVSALRPENDPYRRLHSRLRPGDPLRRDVPEPVDGGYICIIESATAFRYNSVAVIGPPAVSKSGVVCTDVRSPLHGACTGHPPVQYAGSRGCRRFACVSPEWLV